MVQCYHTVLEIRVGKYTIVRTVRAWRTLFYIESWKL